jgi:hypothetical protein
VKTARRIAAQYVGLAKAHGVSPDKVEQKAACTPSVCDQPRYDRF